MSRRDVRKNKAINLRKNLIYCAQHSDDAKVLLLNRDYRPVRHAERNATTEADATFYRRRSDEFDAWCLEQTDLGNQYFYSNAKCRQPDTPECRELTQRIATFMGSGLYRTRQELIDSLKGDPIALLLRDAARMLPQPMVMLINDLLSCGGALKPLPHTFEISLTEQVLKQDLGFVRSTVTDERFRAACAHIGVTVELIRKGAKTGGFATLGISLIDVYGPALQRLESKGKTDKV